MNPDLDFPPPSGPNWGFILLMLAGTACWFGAYLIWRACCG